MIVCACVSMILVLKIKVEMRTKKKNPCVKLRKDKNCDETLGENIKNC